MKKLILFVAVLAIATSAFATGQWDLAVAPRQLTAATALTPAEIGMWEYVYDYTADTDQQLQAIRLLGFDTSLVVNKRDPEGSGWLTTGPYTQRWEGFAATEGGIYSKFYGNFTTVGSVSHDGATWSIEDPVAGLDNIWHAPSDYVAPAGYFGVPDFRSPGTNFGTPGTDNEGIEFRAKASSNTAINGLLMTFRLVHPGAPADITSAVWTYYTGDTYATIVGPGPLASRLGDFDGDGDIDADDIDALGAAIQASSTDLAFDMDGNGLVEQADFNLHVTTLVDTLIGEGSGTMFGDFNLDGVIDLIDLGTLGEQYGIGTGWATGDTDGNGVIDLIDLGSVGENYGFAATAPIPEPATMTLLGLGAVALIRRRRNT